LRDGSVGLTDDCAMGPFGQALLIGNDGTTFAAFLPPFSAMLQMM